MLLRQILLNVSTNLKFFRRSRLMLSIGVVFFIFMAMAMAPTVMMKGSQNRDFMLVKSFFLQLNNFIYIFTALMGLFLVSSHLKGRNIKMVVTKPCLPETWLASGFTTATLVSAALFSLIFLSAAAFSLTLDFPFQSGFAYLTLRSFIMAEITLAYVMLLSILMPAALAAITALIFNEATFYGFSFFFFAGERTYDSITLWFLHKVMTLLYMILPLQSPFGGSLGDITQTMRVTGADWLNLAMACGYMIVITGLYYMLSVVSIRRKRLN